MARSPRAGGVEGGELRTAVLPESAFDAWRSLVDQAPSGSVYSYPEYLEVLCSVAGGRFRILAVLRGEEILGGVGLYERDSGAGRVLSNRLLLYYNGLVVREYASKHPFENVSRTLQILSALEAGLSGLGHAHAVIHSRHPIIDLRPFLAAGWTARPSYSYVMWLHDLQEAYGRVEQNQRRLIRRAQERGISLSDDDDFDAFHRLHLGTHERKGSPIYLSERAFRAYFERLRALGLCRLYQARLSDGRVAASQLVLQGGHPVTHSVSAAADPEFMNAGVNPFLRWKTCEALVAAGYRGNDLTDASLGEVTRFKGQLGAELVVNSVLSSRGSLRFRAWRQTARAYQVGRAWLGAAVRPIRRGGRG
jgi:hypothetical protein